MNFTPEQMTKAKQAKTSEELLAKAKESGIEMTEDEAKKYFAELHKEGELSDDELDAVAGGDKGDEGNTAKEAQEYYVQSCWAPSCDGNYKYNGNPRRRANSGCGSCVHFVPYIEDGNDGSCMREFN